MIRLLAFVAVLLFPVVSIGATPPADLMEPRLHQARSARAPQDSKVVVTLSSKRSDEFTATVKLVSDKAFVLEHRSGKTIEVGGDSGAGALVGWLLTSSRFIVGLQSRGDFRPNKTGVEVVGDAFGYWYGDEPRVVVSRGLDRVLRVAWTDEAKWEAHFTYVDDGDWPRAITVTRAGKPHLRVEVEPAAK